jgi:hypothetical protein
LKTKERFSAPQRICFENGCAEGTLDCGRSSYRFCLARLGGMSAWERTKSGSFAAAVQSASRIFMHSGEPQAHGNLGTESGDESPHSETLVHMAVV